MLETYTYDGLGPTGTRLDACPFCGHEFDRHDERPEHFLAEHGPEDAGLSAVGERPPAATEPLFVPVEQLPGGEMA